MSAIADKPPRSLDARHDLDGLRARVRPSQPDVGAIGRVAMGVSVGVAALVLGGVLASGWPLLGGLILGGGLALSRWEGVGAGTRRLELHMDARHVEIVERVWGRVVRRDRLRVDQIERVTLDADLRALVLFGWAQGERWTDAGGWRDAVPLRMIELAGEDDASILWLGQALEAQLGATERPEAEGTVPEAVRALAARSQPDD